MKQPLIALGVLLGATTFNAQAALTSYSGTGNVGLVYSSISNVTWTQDANLFKTLYDADNTLVSQIAAVTPTYNDSYWGLQTIDASDFNTSSGQMSWWGGLAFTNYLNSINYGGSNQWRLPSVTDTGTAGCDFAFSGTDCGYNVDTSTGELASLYYDELDAKAYYNTSGTPQSGYNILGTSTITNTTGSIGPFDNVNIDTYWSGTENAPLPRLAWLFGADVGLQGQGYKEDLQLYAWAISPGQVPAVPVPGAVWMFGSALIGLVGLNKRRS